MSVERISMLCKKYPSLERIDIQRIDEISRIILERNTKSILKDILLPDVSEPILRALYNHCTFLHGGLLVFTTSLNELRNLIEDVGFSVEHIFPSVIVKKRICKRYGLDEKLVDIHILQGTFRSEDSPPKSIELFMFPQDTPGFTEDICHTERSQELETHFAFQPLHPDIIILNGMISTLKRYGGFLDDGGGSNPFEDRGMGGKTVIYLTKTVIDTESSKKSVRIEITFQGIYKEFS